VNPKFGKAYDGQTVDFIPVEAEAGPPEVHLQNFGELNFLRNQAFVSGDRWRKLGEFASLERIWLRRRNKEGTPTGQVLAYPGSLFRNGSSFDEHWNKCHK
jgi:hypothetical protein